MSRWMRRSNVRWLGGLAALAAVVTLIVVSSTGDDSQPAGERATSTDEASGGTLVVGEQLEVAGLDPGTFAGSFAASNLWHRVYDTLVTIGRDLEIEPSLATSWEQTAPTVYEFTIRRGVRFSSGREMTVADVVGSLRRLIGPDSASPWASQLGAVRRIAASGPWKIKFTLKTPDTPLLAALANPAASVLPMKELKAGDFDPAKELLGTGPFKVASHVKDESWTLERNPHYWRDGLPKADRLIVRIIPDDTARIAALRNGSIHLTQFDRPDTVNFLKEVPNVETVVQNTTDFDYLGVNSSPSSIFSDPRLRQAVSLAIDRAKIVEVALAGTGQPTAAVPAPFGACDPESMPFASPDLESARELVAAAGATGKRVSIVAGTFDSTLSPIAQVIQENLKAVGFDARVEPLESGVMIRRVYSGEDFGTADFDLIVNWFAGYADPAMVLNWWNPDLAGFNRSWVAPDDRLNALVQEARATPAGPARDRVLGRTCERIAEAARMVPLVTRSVVVGYRSDLVDPEIDPVEGYTITLRHVAEFTAPT